LIRFLDKSQHNNEDIGDWVMNAIDEIRKGKEKIDDIIKKRGYGLKSIQSHNHERNTGWTSR
jgi:hypothetical protein